MTWPHRDAAQAPAAGGPWLIDPQGKLCDPASVLEGLCGEAANAAKDCDTGGFCARNLGYIECKWKDGVALCRLRPLTATPEAMQAARLWLSAIPGRVRLHLWVKGWMLESYDTGIAAAGRLDEMRQLSTPERPDEAVLTKAQPIDQLFTLEGHQFRPLLLRWRIANGRFDPSLGYWLGHFGLSDRLTIAEVTKDHPRGIIRYLGPGITVHGRDFHLRAIGMPVEEQPSRDYAGWVGRSYEEVADSGRPRAEHVDALIKEPNGKTRRSRYERLLLPFSDRARRLVFAISRLQPRIAVPLYR